MPAVTDYGAHIQTIANGDLTHEIEAEGRSEMDQPAAGLKTMQQSLIRTVSAVRDSMGPYLTGADKISTGSSDLSSRTDQQASAL